MNALAWTEELRLNQPLMDRTHEEFVDLLGMVRALLDEADRPGALAAFVRLLDHTIEHFGQEDRWMRATGFTADNCHARQHAMVLQVMREVARRAGDGADWEPLESVVSELAVWFPQHAQMMDAGLALHMDEVGFDPLTGTLRGALPQAEIAHCGSAGCR